jgi:hypothetical protein
LKATLTFFFDKKNHDSNRNFEKPVLRFFIFLYFYIAAVLLVNLSIKDDGDIMVLDEFVEIFEDFSFVSLKENHFINQFHQKLKYL